MSAPPANALPILGFLFGLAMAGVAAGIWLADVPEFSRRAMPFSGGLLMGIACFWLLPEIAAESGWANALAGMAAGLTLLWTINRFLYPICPACSHTHDHGNCIKQLHGFAAPLMIAAAVHTFFDGWGVVVSQEQAANGLKVVFLVGVAAHKLPEGLALGALLLAATGSVWKAAAGSALVQSGMMVGAVTALMMSSNAAARTTSLFLAVASGVFVYLGYHAIEGQWKDRPLATTFVPALTGAAGAAVLRLMPGL